MIYVILLVDCGFVCCVCRLLVDAGAAHYPHEFLAVDWLSAVALPSGQGCGWPVNTLLLVRSASTQSLSAVLCMCVFVALRSK